MATAASAQAVGKPLQLMSYEEQRRHKIEDCLLRRKYANSVADQARSRLASRVYLKDKTNFERVQAAKRQTEARVFEGGKKESKKPIQNRTTCQSSTRSESTLLKQRAKPSIKNTNSDTSETKMPAKQIAQPEKLPSSAQENNSKVEQKSKGNTSAATNETKLPAQQTVESEKLPLDQKNNSDIEQKSKGKSQPKMQNVTLSQSFLSVKNEQAKLMIAEKSNKSKPPNSTFKKPVLGSFRGKIVESKIQSFRLSSRQNKKQEKSDLVTSTSVTEVQNKESRGKLHKPRPKGVENVHPVRKTLNVTSHSKQESLTAATDLSTPNSQKPLATDVLKIKLDFKQSGSGDTATAQTLSAPSAKKTAVPFQNTSKGAPAKLPGWKLSKVGGNHKPMKHKESTEEKRTKLTQWMTSKGKLVKRPAMTPLQRKKVVEEPVKSIWTTIAEEDNEGEFENKINQCLSECLKRINEGCPSEDALQTLQTFIESVPKAKKFVRYWICLAQLEQRKGSVHGVMTVYEQAIRMGAQPAEELRNTLADILRNTKTPKKPCDDDGAQQDPELEMYYMTEQKPPEEEVDLADNEQTPPREENVYCTDDKQGLPLEEQVACVAATEEHSVSKENEKDPMANEQQLPSDEGVDLTADEQQLSVKQEVEPTTEEQPLPSVVDKVDDKEGCEAETKENYVEGDYEIEEVDDVIEDMKTPVKQIMTPNKIENRGSSVKYNVKATPNSQCAKNTVQLEKSNSTIKDVKFLTPVRRSRRIEQVSSQLPLMLQDHDPSVSSLEDLKKLGEVSTAYAFRVNSALPECTNISTE
ncbi:cytoskeleton-associated protein 2 [Heptranchias perlo]|uniref:cytoskeleton-associated protein 2 n=1 Tax=Heptranchias perlo TaxID=212740 RepID=UPI00355A112E